STEKVAGIVRDMARAEAAGPVASVIGASFKTSPQLAALANGVASHALDFDFTYTQGQLMAPVIPALLPLAEATGATPAEVLAAFIVGFEVCSRLSRANPTHNGVGAWHGTSTFGAISAAVACARLLKLPAAKIPDVIGIAVSLASGVNANYGTMTKPLHAGHAAKNGMMAAPARSIQPTWRPRSSICNTSSPLRWRTARRISPRSNRKPSRTNA